MPGSAKIEVTKLDAGKRQLRSAIRLWFYDGDPVSIHTLLSAAHEIIHRLYRNKGLENLVFDTDIIKDEYRGEWAKLLKQAPNFFKHANQDSDATLSFNPSVNDLLPMFLIQALCDMGEELDLPERAFVYWTRIHQPELFKSGVRVPPDEALKQLRGVDKKEFFKASELLWAQGILYKPLPPRAPELKGR